MTAGRLGAASSAFTVLRAAKLTSGFRSWSTTTTRSSSPSTPEEGYHLSIDLADKAIEFIQDAHVNCSG